MISRKLYSGFQIVAGACDAATGLLLILAPALALRMMGVRAVPKEPVFISFIGTFVFSVGLAYLLFARSPRSMEQVAARRSAWLITGVERLCVGIFVMIAVASRQMEPAWFSITIIDLSAGAIQLLGLRRNWIEKML